MRKSQVHYSREYRPEQEIPKRKLKSSTGRKPKTIFILIILVFLVFSYFFFFSPIFEIKKIEVSGNQIISEEEIQDSLHNFLFKRFLFFNRNNFFLAAKNKLTSALIQDFPRILSIDITKNIVKRTINLKIVERKEIGIFCRETCYYIDIEGVVFEEAPQTSGTLILVINDLSKNIVRLGERVIEKEFMFGLLDMRNCLIDRFNLVAVDFVIEAAPSQDLKTNTHEGWYILFDRSQDFKNQLQSLALVLENKITDQERQTLEYIDLRIDNRVYYK